MAVEIETKGQLLEFLDVLRKRSWQVILPAAFMITLGVAAAVLVPKKYLVQTQIELRPVGMSVSSKEGGNATFQIRSVERIKKVVEALGHPDYLALPPEEKRPFLLEMQNDVQVKLDKSDSQGSTFVTISYADVEPQWAVDFLRELRRSWIDDVIERDRNKLDDELKQLRDLNKLLESQLGKANDEFTDLRREYNISATQPIIGTTAAREEHPTYARLQQTKSDLGELAVEIGTLTVEIDSMQAQFDALPEQMTREMVVAGVDNEKELKQVELDILHLREELDGYLPAHSKYRLTLNKIELLEERARQLTQLVTKSQRQEVPMPNLERMDLRAEIAKAKTRLLAQQTREKLLKESMAADELEVQRLQGVYSELAQKSNSIENLRQASLDAERRYQEKNAQVVIIAGPLANPFEITEDVTPPIKPTEPNPFLIIAFSVAAGFGLGMGLAVFLEYTKNCFRSPHDITRVMVIPVLGTINSIITRREARMRTARRTAVGLSSAVVIASIVFVTWAWQNHPTLLSQELRDTIEDLRSQFR
jgi:capsular polysaccharide biosynthesis protein